MKIKISAFLLSVITLFACNNTGTPGNEVTKSARKEEHIEHIEPAKALSLNNEEKWQSDKSTWDHVKKLSDIFKVFEGNSRSGITDYQLLGSEVQTELDGLIKDCKMSGPDHDALHLWLEPVLKSTADLKNVNTMEEAEAFVEVITKEIDKFNTYFK